MLSFGETMKKVLLAILCCLGSFSLCGEEVPQYLYKVLSDKNWEASQNEANLVLPPEDHPFIHFSKEDQLDRIVTKYWSGVPKYVILTIETDKLEGQLVYEVNPGGSSTKYYHLYNGSIPLDAVVDSKIVQR
jgi:uncharacterized protein (DUF952 family)